MTKIVHCRLQSQPFNNLLLEASGQFIRSKSATVNFTIAEAKIVKAIIDAGIAGFSTADILALLGHDVTDRSINICRTHISNIRQKFAFIDDGNISLDFDRVRQRYAFNSLES